MMTYPGPELEQVLDDAVGMRNVDPGGMVSLIAGFPDQLEEALQISGDIDLSRNLRGLRNIVMVGLGGSGISADIARELVSSEIRVPVVIVKGYDMPGFVNNETLVFFSSYSGNTEEVLGAFETARARGAKIVCITSGGRLLVDATRHGLPVIVIPAGFPPRCALAYLSVPVLSILGRLGYIEDRQEALREAIPLVRSLGSSVRPEAPASVNQAKRLALAMYGKTPVIYGASGITSVAAWRWKTQINENSKAHAFCNTFPELNHNEILGWGARHDISKAMHVVVLRDREDHPRVQLGMEIAKRFMTEASGVSEVFTHGTTKEAKLMTLIHIGDFVSLYLAFLYGQDPRPVTAIDHLKDRLTASL